MGRQATIVTSELLGALIDADVMPTEDVEVG